MNIGGCRLYCVDQSAVLINADMGLIAKVPGVALLGLMGIRIPLLLLVLGGRRCGNDGGIHDRALFQDEPPLREQGHDLRKQLLLQSAFRKQIPKTPNGIPIRYLIAGINAAEI